MKKLINENIKIIVTGYARHGKDTVCNYLRDSYGLSFVSSSYFVAERAVIPYLAAKGIVYDNLEDCYNDRVNHRADWFDAIREFNKDDDARLGKELFAKHDIYCGLRAKPELLALKRAGLVNGIIWVDRVKIVPEEKNSSITISRLDCDYVLDNNHNLELTYQFLDLIIRDIDRNFIPF